MDNAFEDRLREQAKLLREYLGPCGADFLVLVEFARTAARIGAEMERDEIADSIHSDYAAVADAIRARGGKP